MRTPATSVGAMLPTRALAEPHPQVWVTGWQAGRMSRLELDPTEIGPGATYGWLTSLVVPRPIAWVSSTSAAGVDNLAPHSFFTVSSQDPPVVQFTSVGRKDTLRNVEETGEFVVNVATEDLIELVNASGTNYPRTMGEFDALGIDREPSSVVRPPRVAASPAAFECVAVGFKAFGTDDSGSTVVFGRVVHIAVDDDVGSRRQGAHRAAAAGRPSRWRRVDDDRRGQPAPPDPLRGGAEGRPASDGAGRDQPPVSRRRRGFETLGDMARSLGVVLAVVALVVLITIRTKGQDIRVVDYGPTLAQAKIGAPFVLVAPEGLGASWQATSVYFDPPERTGVAGRDPLAHRVRHADRPVRRHGADERARP